MAPQPCAIRVPSPPAVRETSHLQATWPPVRPSSSSRPQASRNTKRANLKTVVRQHPPQVRFLLPSRPVLSSEFVRYPSSDYAPMRASSRVRCAIRMPLLVQGEAGPLHRSAASRSTPGSRCPNDRGTSGSFAELGTNTPLLFRRPLRDLGGAEPAPLFFGRRTQVRKLLILG